MGSYYATPLGALAHELELSTLAIQILLVIAAPTLRGELRRLFAILANDPTRATVDELLIQQILGESPETRSDITHELRPSGALCRFGLVHVDRSRPRPHAGLAVDPVVITRLRAEPIELGAGAATFIRVADRNLAELSIPSELVLEAMRYLSQSPSDTYQPRIAVRGAVGSGRRTLVAAFAHKAGRDAGDDVRGNDRAYSHIKNHVLQPLDAALAGDKKYAHSVATALRMHGYLRDK